jgi:hypothetical protein
MFLNDFNLSQNIYQKVTARAISGDHTFKVSKNIFIVRTGDDNKFEYEYIKYGGRPRFREVSYEYIDCYITIYIIR